MTTVHGTVRNRTILIVDDDPQVLDALNLAFTDAGERGVSACGTFEKAKQALRSHPFDVLITDVRLGAFNGLQLAVLARDLYPEIQLIVFSGFDDPVLKEEAYRIGALYLVKPVTARTLLNLIG